MCALIIMHNSKAQSRSYNRYKSYECICHGIYQDRIDQWDHMQPRMLLGVLKGGGGAASVHWGKNVQVLL